MIINKERENNTLVVSVAGRLDTSTAPELETALKGELSEGLDLVFDFANLEYISSSGIRQLISAYKVTGKVSIKNANEVVKEVFEVTGITDILEVK